MLAQKHAHAVEARGPWLCVTFFDERVCNGCTLFIVRSRVGRTQCSSVCRNSYIRCKPLPQHTCSRPKNQYQNWELIHHKYHNHQMSFENLRAGSHDFATTHLQPARNTIWDLNGFTSTEPQAADVFWSYTPESWKLWHCRSTSAAARKTVWRIDHW